MLRFTIFVLPLVSGWVTISQSRFGAQLEDIRLLMHIPDNHTAGWQWPLHGVPDQQLLGCTPTRTRTQVFCR